MADNISIADLMVEMMPFSKELASWCKSNPKFLSALKFIYSDKFISLGGIVISYPSTGDEVIGIYTYDYKRKDPIFKQDFIINTGRLNSEFILFTRNPTGSSKYVKDINEFYKKYGVQGNYINSHHLRLDNLPEEIKPRALKAIEIAEKIKKYGPPNLSQEIINKTYKDILTIKRGEWYEKQKLWSIKLLKKLSN